MQSLNANNPAKLGQGMGIAVLVLLTIAAIPRTAAQSLQQGISVQLVPTTSAVPVPGADNSNALIVTLTNNGTIYLGTDSVPPDSLAQKLKNGLSGARNLYIKADAKAPYASLVNVVDAAHTAGVARVTLLTAQPRATSTGKRVLPEGIEMELRPKSSISK